MADAKDKRIIIYPSYINSKCTVAEGRRIALAAACDMPNVFEMKDCCTALKLESEVQNKHYPREWQRMGRLRVALFNADGAPVNPDIPTRRALMLKMAEMVPKHVGRSKKGGGAAAAPALTGAAGSSSSGGASSSKGGSSKKGGKKKK